MRKAVLLIVFSSVFVGVIMLVRAYFLQDTGSGLGFEVPGLGRNGPASIAGVQLGQSTAGGQAVWGVDISESPRLPATKGVWLEISSGSLTYVGELVGETYSSRYIFPASAREYRLFPNGGALYVKAGEGASRSAVIGIEAESNRELFAAQLGQEVHSAFFHPITKEIYLVLEADGQHTFRLLKPNRTLVDLLQTREYGGQELHIIHVDSSAADLYFQAITQATPACFKLNLTSRQKAKVDCRLVPNESSKIFLDTESNSIGKVELPGGKESLVVQGLVGSILDISNINDNFFAYLFETPEGDSLVEDVNVFNLKTNRIERAVAELPSGDILDVGIGMDGGVVIVVNNFVSKEVYIEKEDNEIGWELVQLEECTADCTIKILK